MAKREWAESALPLLQKGQTVRVQPRGHSMAGRIGDGDWVTLTPCVASELEVGDIVLARVVGRRYAILVLHLILAREGEKFLIGNNRGRQDDWVEADQIFGKVTVGHGG